MNFQKALIVCMLLVNVVNSADNQFQERLDSLSEAKRADIFMSIIESSGEKCGKIIKTFHVGIDREQATYWDVLCEGGSTFRIQIKNDAGGSSKVLTGAMVKLLGNKMFEKF